MTSNNKQLNWCEFTVWSLIVIFFWAFVFILNYYCVDPITNKNQINSLSFLSAGLGLLASGSIAGFFSFEYKNADNSEFNIIRTIGYIFISGIFILISLSLYCLAKVGIFQILDKRIIFLLFFGICAVMDGIVLLDIWDAKKRKNIKK